MSELVKAFLNKGREYMCPHGMVVPIQACYLCELTDRIKKLEDALRATSIAHHERIEKLEQKIKR